MTNLSKGLLAAMTSNALFAMLFLYGIWMQPMSGTEFCVAYGGDAVGFMRADDDGQRLGRQRRGLRTISAVIGSGGC